MWDSPVRLAQGKYLADTYKDVFLPANLALQRYYYNHFQGEVKKTALSYAPMEIQILQQQPTKAQKISVAGEIMNNH